MLIIGLTYPYLTSGLPYLGVDTCKQTPNAEATGPVRNPDKHQGR